MFPTMKHNFLVKENYIIQGLMVIKQSASDELTGTEPW